MAEPPRKLKATEATGGNEANFSQNRNLAYAKVKKSTILKVDEFDHGTRKSRKIRS